MSVSAVLTGQDVYRFFLGSSNKNKYAQQTGQDEDTQSKSSDTVQISEEAKELAKKREIEEFIKKLKEEFEYLKSEEEWDKINAKVLTILPAEATACPKWLGKLTPPQLSPASYFKFGPPPPEAGEFYRAVDAIYWDEVKKHEAQNGLDKVKNDDSIRKSVLKRLQEDKRLCELMNLLGIKMPTTEK